MDNNSTAIAAYVAALAAIIAPAVTAIIQSIAQYKITKMNHTLEKRLSLYEAYTNSYEKCQYGPERTGYMFVFYKQTLKLIAMCSHRSVRRALFRLAREVKSHGASKSTDKLFEHCICLLVREF